MGPYHVLPSTRDSIQQKRHHGHVHTPVSDLAALTAGGRTLRNTENYPATTRTHLLTQLQCGRDSSVGTLPSKSTHTS